MFNNFNSQPSDNDIAQSLHRILANQMQKSSSFNLEPVNLANRTLSENNFNNRAHNYYIKTAVVAVRYLMRQHNQAFDQAVNDIVKLIHFHCIGEAVTNIGPRVWDYLPDGLKNELNHARVEWPKIDNVVRQLMQQNSNQGGSPWDRPSGNGGNVPDWVTGMNQQGGGNSQDFHDSYSYTTGGGTNNQNNRNPNDWYYGNQGGNNNNSNDNPSYNQLMDWYKQGGTSNSNDFINPNTNNDHGIYRTGGGFNNSNQNNSIPVGHTPITPYNQEVDYGTSSVDTPVAVDLGPMQSIYDSFNSPEQQAVRDGNVSGGATSIFAQPDLHTLNPAHDTYPDDSFTSAFEADFDAVANAQVMPDWYHTGEPTAAVKSTSAPVQPTQVKEVKPDVDQTLAEEHGAIEYNIRDQRRKQRMLDYSANAKKPVYIVGKQRLINIKVAGKGKFEVIETTRDVTHFIYEEHKTELLVNPESLIITEMTPTPENGAKILDGIKMTHGTEHYREIIKQRQDKGESLDGVLTQKATLQIEKFIDYERDGEFHIPATRAIQEVFGDSADAPSVDDVLINFTTVAGSGFVFTDEAKDALQGIMRVKKASSAAERVDEFFTMGVLPVRECNRLHRILTDHVNRSLAITFANGWSVDNWIDDLTDLREGLLEQGEADLDARLDTIYVDAVRSILRPYAYKDLAHKASEEVIEALGLSKDNSDVILTTTRNVTLLPINYMSIPVAFSGNYGHVNHETSPELYGALKHIINKNPGHNDYMLVTVDNVVIRFFESVYGDLYLSREAK